MNRITRQMVLALALAWTVQAQVPHPRIWLDSATTTRLTGLVAANDPIWVALKAQADQLLTYTVPAYDANVCSANQICYTYGGVGWLNAVEPLGLAYRMTGNVAYANQVKAILNVMAASGTAPMTWNSGYAARGAVLALALGYDWVYDQLSDTDKASYASVLDAWWNWTQTSGGAYAWYGTPNPDDNYYGGVIVGFGLAALAVEGDDGNASAMQFAILTSFNTYVAGPSGILQQSALGGYPIEGFNYGQTHFMRLIQYMQGMKTAGKADLLSANSAWVRTVAKSLLYNLKPDMWSTTDEGGFTGNFSHILTQNYPLFLSDILSRYGSCTESQWMQWLFANMAAVPISGGTPASYRPSSFETFLYNSGVVQKSYSDILISYFSPGDKHLYVRKDWTPASVYMTFNGGTRGTNVGSYTNHQNRSAGHVLVQRGSDYLLIGMANWFGANGIAGTPQYTSDGGPGWKFNTLFYWDGGTTAGGNCLNQTSSNGQYAGCQMFWSPDNTVSHLETPDYSFSEADLRPAYLSNSGQTTLNAYSRTFLNVGGDMAFVFDRIASSSASSTRQIFWHTPALISAATPGNATTISVNGAIASATVGNSTIWISELLPVSASITTVTDPTSWGSATNMGTQRFAVSDPSSAGSPNSLFLTVLAPTAASVSSMPPATLIDTGNYKGALYNDGAFPRVGLFSSDGQPQTSVTYSAAYDAQLTGRHVVLDLKRGFYTVQRDGIILRDGILVGNDGSLNFTSTGGATYTVSQSAQSSPAIRGKAAVAGQSRLK